MSINAINKQIFSLSAVFTMMLLKDKLVGCKMQENYFQHFLFKQIELKTKYTNGKRMIFTF